MRSSLQSWASVSGAVLLLSAAFALPGKPAFAADNQVTFIFGGDVEWALNARPPTVRYRIADPTPYGKVVYGRRDVRDQVTGDWPPFPMSIKVKAALTSRVSASRARAMLRRPKA